MSNPQETPVAKIKVIDLTLDDSDSSTSNASTEGNTSAPVTRKSTPASSAASATGLRSAPRPKIKAEDKPKKTIKKLSLAEQKELTAKTNRIARQSLSKNQKCSLCKCNVPRGYDQIRGRPNIDVHLEGHQHTVNLQKLLGTWATSGCFLCPDKKFSNLTDYEAHLKSKKHIARARLENQKLNANRSGFKVCKN